MSNRENYIRDIGILFTSVALAVVLWRTGALVRLLDIAEPIPWLGSFVSGMFFTSFFTVAPATAAIVELAQRGVPLERVIFLGAAGAMIADYIIYVLLRESIAEPFLLLVRAGSGERLKHFVRNGRNRLVGTILGAAIIASPLPDEIGLLLMGMARARWYVALTLTYVLNAAGIAAVVFVARYI